MQHLFFEFSGKKSHYLEFQDNSLTVYVFEHAESEFETFGRMQLLVFSGNLYFKWCYSFVEHFMMLKHKIVFNLIILFTR